MCWSLYLIKLQGSKASNFIKNRLQHRCLPVKFARFLRTPKGTSAKVCIVASDCYLNQQLSNFVRSAYFYGDKADNPPVYYWRNSNGISKGSY